VTDSAETPSDDYDVFGHGIRFETRDDAIRRRVASALARFRAAGEVDPVACFHLTLSTDQRRVMTGRQINTGRLLVVADREKLIAASLGSLPWQIHIESFGGGDEHAYYYLFEPLLHMVLKRRGMLPWHGAALARGDHGVLIVGQSGSGKSTTALSLLLGGYRFVADDEVMLEAAGAAVLARGIDDHLHYTDSTAALLPGLPPAGGLPTVRRGRGLKRRLTACVFDVHPDPIPVELILFPRVDAAVETGLRRLSAAECARRLLLHPPKEYPAVIVDAQSIEAQFALCTALAVTARCFELILGRRPERLPHLVDAIFQ
jgi:hypothetical protein